MSVLPQKVCSNLNKIGMQVEVDERYKKVCRMTRIKVKVKVTETRKLQQWLISQSISSEAPPVWISSKD